MNYIVKSVSEVLAKDDWKTVSVVLEENTTQYPNSFVASYFKKGEYTKYVDSFNESYPFGTVVEAELKFGVREYNGKNFQDVKLWSIKKVEETVESQEIPDDVNPDDIPF